MAIDDWKFETGQEYENMRALTVYPVLWNKPISWLHHDQKMQWVCVQTNWNNTNMGLAQNHKNEIFRQRRNSLQINTVNFVTINT